VHDGWLLDGFLINNTNPITVVMNSNHTLKAIFVEAVSVSAWASPLTGVAPLAVTFSSLANGGTPPYSYSWSFGDGGIADRQNCSHTYSQPGSYTATLRITDSAGRVGEAQLGIAVTSNAPAISIWLTKSNDISVAQGSSGYSTSASTPAPCDGNIGGPMDGLRARVVQRIPFQDIWRYKLLLYLGILCRHWNPCWGIRAQGHCQRRGRLGAHRRNHRGISGILHAHHIC